MLSAQTQSGVDGGREGAVYLLLEKLMSGVDGLLLADRADTNVLT